MVLGLMILLVVVLGILCLNRQHELTVLRTRIAWLEKQDHRVAPAATAETVREIPPVTLPSAATNTDGTVKTVKLKQHTTVEIEEMLSDPKRKEFMEAMWTAQMDSQYKSLFRYYEMTADERRYIKSLLVEKISRLQDLSLSLIDPALSAEQKAEIERQRDSTLKEIDSRIQDFLGAEAFAMYEGYEKSQAERFLVDQCKTALANANQPIDAAKEDALIRILYEERTALPELSAIWERQELLVGLRAEDKERMLRSFDLWHDRVKGRASTLLNPGQMKTFELYLQQQRDQAEIIVTAVPEMFDE